MRYIGLKLNLVAILLLYESFVEKDIIHKGIIQNSEAFEIKENHNRKLSNDDGGYIKLYYKWHANYNGGFKTYKRKNITYIINEDNGIHISENDAFIVRARNQKDIHFNIPPNNLEYLFSKDMDIR